MACIMSKPILTYVRNLCFRLDAVHIAMYNLTLNGEKKFFEVDDVVTYLNENWEQLQLPWVMRIFLARLHFSAEELLL